jgi:hypothetical protein
MRDLVNKSCKTEVSISGWSTLVKIKFSEQNFLHFLIFFPVIRAGCHVFRMAGRLVALYHQSRICSWGKSRTNFKKEIFKGHSSWVRVRLSRQEKMKLVQYHLANPQLAQKTLIDCYFVTFEMKKRLSGGVMCNLLKPDNFQLYSSLIISSASWSWMKMKSTPMCWTAKVPNEGFFPIFRHNYFHVFAAMVSPQLPESPCE